MSQLQVTGEAKIRDIQGPVVANSGVITALDGAASQYVRGDGTLADFPTSSGGGSSVSYYLNSSVSQGTIGGVAYRELSKEPIIGAGTDIAISSNGYVASYLTDANDPDVLSIPGGNFNCEFYFSVNNNTGNPFFYAELYKYDGTTFTLLGSSVGVPEYINQGTIIAPYYFAIPVATATLALTDRLAIRIYVNVAGRTITLHTENGHLCQVVTTLSKGMVSLNNLTDQSQYLTTGTSGTDFNIVSSGDTHTFNIPSASSANRGLITTGNQTIAGNKVFLAGVNVDNLQVVNATLLNHQTGLTPTLVGTTAIGGSANGLFFNVNDNGRIQEFIFDSTGDRDYTFPAASGTLALTSNLSSYVPYTGATTNVDLGSNYITSATIVFWKGTGSGLGNIGIGRIVPLGQNTTGQGNIGIGENSLFSNTTGSNNIAIGVSSTQVNTTGINNIGIGLGSNSNNVTGSGNVAVGVGALNFNTTNYNTAVGHLSLYYNTTGGNNTALGYSSLYTNTTGSQNTALGAASLYNNTTGSNNTAIGNVALQQNTTGTNNTAIGSFSSYVNTTGQNNTSVGASTLIANTTGSQNTALGTASLQSNTTGESNVAVGVSSLGVNTIGQYNVAVGRSASNANTTGNYNTALGSQALANITTGSQNIAIGYNSGSGITTGSQNTIIGTVTGLSSTLSNNIILADGAGNIRYQWDGTNNVFGNAISGTTATFTGTVSSIVTSGGTSFRVVNSVNSRAWSLVPSTNGAESDLWLYYGGTGGGTKVSFVNNGNVLIGSTTDSGELLQVNGTSKFTGALNGTSATFSGLLTINANSSANALAINGRSSDNTSSIDFFQNNGTTRLMEIGISSSSAEFYYDANAPMIFSTNGTPRLTIASTGAATFSNQVTMNGPNSDWAAVIQNTNSGSGTSYGLRVKAGTSGGADATFVLQDYAGNEFLTARGNGRIGIGTNTPSFILSLGGDSSRTIGMNESTLGTAPSLTIRAADSTTGTNNEGGALYLSAGQGTGNGATSNIIFSTAPSLGSGSTRQSLTERMRLTSGGYLKASNTGTYLGASGTYHELRNNSQDTAGVVIASTNASFTNNVLAIGTSKGSATNFNQIAAYTSDFSNIVFQVRGDGNCYNVNGVYTSGVSDIKYKEQIVDTNSQWEDIKNLRVVNFKFIKDVNENGDDALRHIGFIAQEVEKVSPNLVEEMTDNLTGETWKTIKTSIIYTKAIKALQECMARIEEQQAQIDELKELIKNK
jgi:hypothetical protein